MGKISGFKKSFKNSNFLMNSQTKGDLGERKLVAILENLLDTFSSISSLRRYESGYQGGKDAKLEALLKKNNVLGICGKEKLKWFFEVKNYRSKLNPEKLFLKIHQVKASNVEIDCFCLFSPHEDLSGLFEDSLTNNNLINLPEYPFKIVLWTPSHRIKEKLMAFPQIYKEIYGSEITLDENRHSIIIADWIAEIENQNKEGRKIRLDFLEKFRGNEQIWIPGSVAEAKKCIEEIDGDLNESDIKESSLETKLRTGGITSSIDINQAKKLRIISEGTRRKYKKSNEYIYSKLNALRFELEDFCLNLEKNVLKEKVGAEANDFLNEFSDKIETFIENYRDTELIKKLQPFYLKGQMYDITGECVLSLSRKWLEHINNISGKND